MVSYKINIYLSCRANLEQNFDDCFLKPSKFLADGRSVNPLDLKVINEVPIILMNTMLERKINKALI